MPSFLIFYDTKPVEVHYTELFAAGEERFVVKVGEVGAVIKQGDLNKWECVGKNNIDEQLLQTIGKRIKENVE